MYKNGFTKSDLGAIDTRSSIKISVYKFITAKVGKTVNISTVLEQIKIGRLWFVDLDVFEREIRENGGLKSLELT